MEKIISNADVLIEIFQYLNLEELLKLTKVCPQFCTVIVDFIWKNKYKNLEICKTSQHFGLLLTNNLNKHLQADDDVGIECLKEDKAILNRRDVAGFIKLIQNSIQMLILYCPATNYKHADVAKEGTTLVFTPSEFGIVFDKKHFFKNLTTILFRHVVITTKDLKLLNESCKNLETLCLDNCFNINEKTLVLEDDIKVSTLQSMKNLKCFQIYVFDTVEKDLSYDVFKLLTQLNLLQLNIKVRNFSLVDDDNNEFGLRPQNRLCTKSRCEELKIGYFRSQRIFRKFSNTILGNFNNLKKLVMESWTLVAIDEDFFKNLTRTCSQLEYLQLQNFEFNGFAVISSLNTLMLSNCCGLMWREVMIMLRDIQLKTFSILDTEYMGIFEYFNVATTLKHLLIINCQRNHFKKLLDLNSGQNLRNLTSFVWHDNFAQVPIYVATSCTQLKSLITEPSALLINNLYSLASLEKLTIRVGRKIKFSRIITILKHLNLKHFALTKQEGPTGYDEYNDYLIDYDIYDHELLEFENKRINLTFINISLNSYFKIVQDFWFDLLISNVKLTIMIRYNRLLHSDHTFLKFIINHRKFPSRLKSIKICGYKIAIREFKVNFEAAIEKIKSFSNIYKDKEDRGYILL